MYLSVVSATDVPETGEGSPTGDQTEDQEEVEMTQEPGTSATETLEPQPRYGREEKVRSTRYLVKLRFYTKDLSKPVHHP